MEDKKRSMLSLHSMSSKKALQEGMTLIEVLVAMAIAGILLTSIFGMLLTNIQLSNKAQEQIVAKDAVVAIKEYVYDKVRLAKEVELAMTISTSPSVQGLYIHETTGALMHKKEDGTEYEVFSQKLLGNCAITFVVEKDLADEKLMYLTIIASQLDGGKELYKLKVPIAITNMMEETDKITLNPPSNTTFSVIRFRTP